MSAFLLYHKKTRPTGRKIAEALGINHGANPNEIPRETTKVIRWGNAKTIPQYGIEFVNSARAIMLAGDKLETLRKLQEDGVSCLEFTDRPPENLDHHIWFGRKRRGFGGKDVVALNVQGIWVPSTNPHIWTWQDHEGVRRVAACEFFTKYVDNAREYRIHVVKGEVVRYQRKYPVDGGNQLKASVRVQNHASGYVFKQPHNRLRPERFDACIAAVEALGLDFGAVDMIVDTSVGNGGVTRVLEVNTAPSCSPKTIEAYVNAFKEVL